MGLIDLKDAVLSIQDGGSNVLEIHIGEGNFTWTEKRNVEFVLTRGQLAFTREGNEEPVDVSFEFLWDFLISASGEDVTLREALTQTGAAASWTSSTRDPEQPYSVNLILEYVPPCPSVLKETIVIQDFYETELAYSPKDAAISVKGKANVKRVVSTRG